jgi:hypothetical protein
MALNANRVMGMVVTAALGIYALAYVAFPAITQMFQTDTSAWDSGAASLVGVIAIFLMLGVAVLFAKPALEEL